jgi:DNA-binding phage protein
MTKNLTNEKSPKNVKKYACENCDYNTSKHFDYMKHLSTLKHKTQLLGDISCEKVACVYECNCGKKYNHASSLWNHKQKCLQISTTIEAPTPTPTPLQVDDHLQMTLILELVKQNQEFKDLLIQQSAQMMEQNKTMIEVAKNSQINNTINNNTISNNTNNSINKTFNLQFFLNETCKDAMNMKDFIKSLELSLPELEKMGEIGFAEGMSRVFVNRLNSLDITKRPIHCSDVKREIIHIKDDNKWEMDNANLDRLRKIIKQLTLKNILKVDDWKKANQGCTEYNSRKNGQYLKINMEAIGPVDEAEVKRDFGKIIRRVAESTAIDKKYLMA